MAGKKQLAEVVASNFNTTKEEASRIITTVFKSIVEIAASGETVGVRGFGTFSKVNRKARVMSGLETLKGQTKTIPARSVLKFKSAVKATEL